LKALTNVSVRVTVLSVTTSEGAMTHWLLGGL